MKDKSAKSTIKKIFSILLNILVYLFFAVCVFVLIVTITAKKDSDGALMIFGHEMRIVASPSMEKCEETDVSAYKIKDIPVHSMVFIELVPEEEDKAAEWYGALETGDVLTFRYVYASQVTITHRITKIEPNGAGGYVIELAGDNKNDADGVLVQTIDTSADNKNSGSFHYVIGKVVAVNVPIGFLVYAVSQPVGMVLIIIVPCAIIIILMIIRIFGVVSGERRRKDKEEKDGEIEELKRRLAELEKREAGEEDGGKHQEGGNNE